MDTDWLATKEQVRQATDIVDLVGGYAPLRRQGREYLALCPWHDDTKPSLHVNAERQSFKCFVCDIGGDVFSFIMRIEGVEFREALEMLADRAGIKLHAPQPQQAAGSVDDKRTLYQAMAWAEQQYHQCLLQAPEAEAGRKYLAERGISQQSIAKFHIGYAPERWDWLLSRAAKVPFAPAVLERVGLAIARPSGGGYYDRFRGRVLFPIRDVHTQQPRPIALGGRILPHLAGEDTAKYINSPETPLFSKNRQVYGLDVARAEISKQRNVLVVEGYTDCVMLHQYGVEHVVAVLGTALGERHISLLRRFADTITLVLDGDEAGQRRTNQILELFVAAQVDLKILTLPRNLDPCDFLVSHGSDQFRQLLSGAIDALEHKIRTVTKGLDLTTDTHQAHQALEDVLGTLSRAPRLATSTPTSMRLREHQVLSRLAHSFRVPEQQLRDRVAELRGQGRRQLTQPATPVRSATAGQMSATSSIGLWDRMLLELLLLAPDKLPQVAEVIAPGEIESAACRAIYAKCLQLMQAGVRADFSRLMLESEDPRMKNLLVDLEHGGRAKGGSDPEAALRDVLENFRRKQEDIRLRNSFSVSESGTQVSEEQSLDALIASLKTRQSKS